MRYKKLTLENFRTFEGKHEFVFPDNKPLVVIHAINGTGKSAMLHAMNYVLYGEAINPKSLSGDKFSIKQLLSIPAYENNNRFFSITLEFENEGKNYEINRRTQLRGEVSIPNPEEDRYYETLLYVKKDGEVLSAAMSQPEIENLINKAVSRFFLVNREEIQELDTALLDERENELIKSEIEKSLGVEVLERGKNILNNIAIEFNKEAVKDTDNSKKAEKSREDYEGEVERVEKAKSSIAELKKKLNETQEKLLGLEKEQNSMKSIEEEAAKKQLLSEQLNSFEKQKIEKTNSIREYVMKNWFLPISDIAIKEYENAKRAQEDAHQIKSKLQNISLEIKKLESEIKTEKCKNCNQPINKTQVEKIKKKLEMEFKSKEELEAQYIEPTEVFPSVQVISPYIQPSIDTLEALESQLASLELDIFTIKNSISKIDKGFDESLVAEVKNLRVKIKQQQEIETLTKQNLEDKEHELKMYSNRLKSLEKDIEKYTSDSKTSTKKSQFAKGIRDLFENAFEKFRDSAREDVAKLAKAVFENLINTEGFQIDLENDYSISLTDENGRNAGTPSAGQSGVIAISLITALAKNSVTNAPIIMDSPMASLDDIHTKKVWEFIHQIADQVILFVFPGEYDEKEHRKIIQKNLSVEYTLEKVGVYNAKIIQGYKPQLLEG